MAGDARTVAKIRGFLLFLQMVGPPVEGVASSITASLGLQASRSSLETTSIRIALSPFPSVLPARYACVRLYVSACVYARACTHMCAQVTALLYAFTSANSGICLYVLSAMLLRD